MMYDNYYGNFRNRSFSDIFPLAEAFLDEYKSSDLYDSTTALSDPNIRRLYYLLYANYGNSTIASFDETQFKYQVFSTIFMYGPTWQKELEVQRQLRGLSEDDIVSAGKQIYNKALNPGTEPTTEELAMVSEQTVSKGSRSKLQGYGMLLELLKNDVTKDFIDRFKKFFLQIVMPEKALWFKTTNEEEE